MTMRQTLMEFPDIDDDGPVHTTCCKADEPTRALCGLEVRGPLLEGKVATPTCVVCVDLEPLDLCPETGERCTEV